MLVPQENCAVPMILKTGDIGKRQPGQYVALRLLYRLSDRKTLILVVLGLCGLDKNRGIGNILLNAVIKKFPGS